MQLFISSLTIGIGFASFTSCPDPQRSEDSYDQGAVSKCFVSKHHMDRDDLKFQK